MIKKILFFLIVVAAFTVSCDRYKKILKGTDKELKYETAIKLYNQQDYNTAIQFFEELITLFRGQEKAEKVYYYYAYSYFGTGDFMMAGFHFKSFTKLYPSSKYAEECAYMSAFCKYNDAPGYSLDQSATIDAINELQLFTNLYPKSEKVHKCNDLIDELRNRLAKKYFDLATLYYRISSYNASIISFNNLLKEYPETTYREESMLFLLKSYYYYAENSVDEKKLERFNATIDQYNTFVTAFPASKFKKEAESIYSSTMKEINKLKKTN